MTAEQNKAVVRRFNKEFIEGGNMASFHEIIAPDFINQSAPPGTPTGPEGVVYFFNHLLKPSFSNFTVEIYDQAAEDDKVTTRKAFHATHTADFFGVPATNKNVVMNVIDIIRLKDGKFAEHWGILDMQGLMSQLSS